MATKELIQEYQSTKGKPYKRVVKPFKIVAKTPKPKSQNLRKPSKAQIEGRFTGASGLKLLSYGGTNTKTAKNAIESYIMYLSPYKDNSKNISVCPKATKGCVASCLYTAGRGKFSSVIMGRQRRTELYVNNKPLFLDILMDDLLKIKAKRERASNIEDKRPDIAIRFNGTSDLDFIGMLNTKFNTNILNWKGFKFYDYTKIIGKIDKYRNTPYVQTFSMAEGNTDDVYQAIKWGVNVAAVFRSELPPSINIYSNKENKFMKVKVVDGDKTDIEMLKFKGVILGLKAKGKAKKDTTGFVIDYKRPV
jgi:hypothetical protein